MRGWKYVSRGECVKTLIWVIIAACILFIPATFGSSGLVFTFKTMPLIGDNSFKVLSESAIQGFCSLIPSISETLIDCLRYCFTYGIYFYFGILILDILFALILIITQHNSIRMFAKIFSVFFGIVMLFIAIIFIIYIVGAIIVMAKQSDMIAALEVSGITTAAGFLVFSLIIGIKQFKWFSKAF